jgi:hypothetical protein
VPRVILDPVAAAVAGWGEDVEAASPALVRVPAAAAVVEVLPLDEEGYLQPDGFSTPIGEAQASLINEVSLLGHCSN